MATQGDSVVTRMEVAGQWEAGGESIGVYGQKGARKMREEGMEGRICERGLGKEGTKGKNGVGVRA